MRYIFSVEYDSVEHDHGHALIFIHQFYFLIDFFGLLSKHLPCATLINLSMKGFSA